MGRGEEEKSGIMKGKWMTVILIAIFVILAIILIVILKDPRGFERFKRKKKPEDLRPDKTGTISQRLRNPNNQPGLELIDSGLRLVTELSWEKPVLPSQV